ncbi:MAG: PAS domain S-box protein [Candidatus Cloacimonetes bacterium]|nr:PAS domain S-box protein [Candidatus Cloacimonadota bacterium]
MSKGKIIIVDDDNLIQLTIKEILIEFDYEVIATYSTGEEVVYNAPELKPDLIIMDIQLNGYIDGIEAGERIKSVIDIPIIYISGMDDESTIERTKLSDPFGYILKPFKAKELIIIVELAIYKHQTQQKIQLNEFFFKSTFNSISEGIITIDKVGIIKLVNPFAEKMFNKIFGNIINKNILEIIKTKSTLFEQFLRNSINTQKWTLNYSQSFEAEYELSIKDTNQYKPVFLSLNALYDSKESIMGYVITIRDLTDQKKTRDLINKLYMAIKQSSIGIIMLSPEGVIEYINPRYEQITQFKYEEIIGRRLKYLFNEKVSKEKINDILYGISNNQELSFEWQNYKKDSSMYWELFTLTPVINDKGTVIQFVILIEDITDKKNYETNILYNEKKYKDLFNNTPVAICNFDFSEVSEYLSSLKNININDLQEYFNLSPEYFNNCIHKIKIIDINKFAEKLLNITNSNNNFTTINLIFKQNFDFTLKILQHLLVSIESINNKELHIFEKLYIPQSEIINITLESNKRYLHTVWFCQQDKIDYKNQTDNINPINLSFNLLIVAVDITEKIITENKLKIQTYHLKERIKEQTTLYQINNIITKKNLSLEEVFDLSANEIIKGFQYPENTACKITFNDLKSYSNNFRKLISPIIEENFNTNDTKYNNDNCKHLSQSETIDNDNKIKIEIFLQHNKVNLSNNEPEEYFFNEEKNLLLTIKQLLSEYILKHNQAQFIEKRLQNESLISKLSSRFLNIYDFDETINQALEDIAKSSNADRTYVFEYDENNNTISNTFEWCKKPQLSIKATLQNLPFDDYPWWKEKIYSKKLIYIKDINDMPIEAKTEQQLFQKQEIKSLLCIPLIIKSKSYNLNNTISSDNQIKMIGFVGFDNLHQKSAWSQQDITLLKIFCDILSSTYERKQSYELINNQKEFSNQIINSVAELIVVINIQSEKIVVFNQHCEHLSGYNLVEVQTLQQFKNLFINEQVEYFNKIYQETLKGKSYSNIEFLWRTKYKKFLMINWQFNIIKNPKNTPAFIILNGTDISEIKKQESLLKEKETQYRTLIQNLNIGIYRSTGLNSGHFLQANIALSEMLGYASVQELLLKKEKDIFLNPADRDEMLKIAIQRGKLNNYEVLLKKKNILNNNDTKNTIWVSINAKAIYDENNNFKWLDAFVEDITEKKKNKEALNNQLLFLQNLIDNIPVPIYYTDAIESSNHELNKFDYIITGCNISFEKFIGKSRNQLINKKLSDCLSNDLYITFTKYNDKLITTNLNNDNNNKIDNLFVYAQNININNSEYYILFHKALFENKDCNKIITNEVTPNFGIINSLIDVTDLKQIQQKMQRLAIFNQNILSSITNILIAVDNNLKITHWNHQVSFITKIPPEQALNKNIEEIFIDWDIDLLIKTISKVRKSLLEEKILNFLIKSVKAPQLIKPEENEQINKFYRLTISPIKKSDLNSNSKGSTLDGFLILGEDVTEIQTLQHQLIHHQKLEAIGQLAAGIAHEINTPAQYVTDNNLFIQDSVNQIISFITKFNQRCTSLNNQLVNETNIDKLKEHLLIIHKDNLNMQDEIDFNFLIEEMPKAIEQSLEGLANISKIVKAMKDFSHPGIDSTTISNINQLINSTVTVARNEWKYSANVTLNFDENLPNIPCLPSEFNQAILNIIINATHAIKERYNDSQKGEIRVKTSFDSNYVNIEISDNGVGIPSNIQDKIFDPFFTTKKIGEGTGQGLSIVYQIIVEKHNGKLYVSSEINQGTTFKIQLPIP